MGEPVLSDPQFSVAKILRPFAGFEAVYQGQAARIPIQVTQGGEALDANAGKPGYAPNLLKGLSIPMGARLLIWLPSLNASVIQPPPSPLPYKWEITWRMRDVFDFRQSRIPYHYPKQGLGVPDGVSPRVVIPAAAHGSVYNQAEPATPPIDVGVVQNIRTEDITARGRAYGAGTGTDLPLIPAGTPGAFEQGILPTTLFQAPRPIYDVFEVMAAGDELMLGLHRDQTGAANWDFAVGGIDQIVSTFLGTGTGRAFPDVGVYVMIGVAP